MENNRIFVVALNAYTHSLYSFKTTYKILLIINNFVHQKALIRTFNTSFLTTQKPLWIHSIITQIQKWFCTQNLVLNI